MAGKTTSGCGRKGNVVFDMAKLGEGGECKERDIWERKRERQQCGKSEAGKSKEGKQDKSWQKIGKT